MRCSSNNMTIYPARKQQTTRDRRTNVVEQPQSGTITALKTGRNERLFVFLDGAYAFATTKSIAIDEGLRLGKELDEATVMRLRAAHSVARATAMIDVLTAYRPRTVAELRSRLIKKGIDPKIIELAIANRFNRNFGVFSDAEFIDWFASKRGITRGKNFTAIIPELRRLGVSEEAINAAKTSYNRKRALTIALSKAVHGLDLSHPKDRRRFVQRLLRRGFNYEDALGYLNKRDDSDDASE